MNRRTVLVTFALAIAVSTQAFAQASRDGLKTLSDRAVAHFKSAGKDQALKDFSSDKSKWYPGPGNYVAVIDFEGTVVAHAANEKIIGRNILNIKDPSGRPITHDQIALAKAGGGFIESSFMNVETKKVTDNVQYIQKLPGMDAFVLTVQFK